MSRFDYSTQCACPGGEWRPDLKEKKCQKHTICKPGQAVTQKASIRKDRKCKDCSDTECVVRASN